MTAAVSPVRYDTCDFPGSFACRPGWPCESGSGFMQWVAFDAVGTLIFPDPPADVVYFEAAQRFGSRLSRAEIAVRFSRAFRDAEKLGVVAGSAAHQSLVGAPYATSERDEIEKWRFIVSRVIDDAAEPATCFDELFAHFARPGSWRCCADAPAVLTTLRAAGCRLALASNFDGRLHTICDSLPLLRSMDLCVISSEVGWRKPSPRFYEELLKRANCLPHEMLMVGDDFINDVSGAQSAGLAAIWLNTRAPAGGEYVITRLSELPAAIAALGQRTTRQSQSGGSAP